MKCLFALICITALLWCGCARIGWQASKSYQTVADHRDHDTRRAIKKHQQALDLLCDMDYCGAEQLLSEALICDVQYGPAHNTLGSVYFDQNKFYLAAWEFEYAMKFMPNRAEPINNLGLVHEAVGDLSKAAVYFQMAWDMDQGNAEYLGNLLRARMRDGDQSAELKGLFKRLIEIDDRQDWVDWARGKLAMDDFDPPITEELPGVQPPEGGILVPLFDLADPAKEVDR